MNQLESGGDGREVDLKSGRSTDTVPGLDLQLLELIEAVWACERVWKLEGRLDAVVEKEWES